MKNDLVSYTSFILIVPLVLSAFTHLWNPIGFPTFHVDEGHYMRRAMQVLRGLGPQEPTSSYVFSYDHPYFGQLFLAGALNIIGYPDSLASKSGDIHSIKMLYLAPRVLMGLLAIIDTFLIYKIAERRYNQNIAFMASILFAVMPIGWMTRGIFLESILLPLLLSSILFALYTDKSRTFKDGFRNNKNIMILISGIFFGLAVFTKAPIFIMIPLPAMLIIKYNRNNFKTAAFLWFCPVILIPLLWPSYAAGTGHIAEWLDGVIYQLERESNNTLYNSITLLSKIDPVMLLLGVSGFIYTQLKRDYFLTAWVIPYFVFLNFIGWVTHFHWIVLLPPLCIAAGVLFEDISSRFISNKKNTNVSRLAIISTLTIFGLVMTTSIITLDLNSSYLQIYAYTINELKDHVQANYGKNNHQTNNEFTIIGGQRAKALTWIPQYVIDINFLFKDTDNPKDNFTSPTMSSGKVLFIVDSNVRSGWISCLPCNEKGSRLHNIYYDGDTVATFINMQYDIYDFINGDANHGLGRFVEIKANY